MRWKPTARQIEKLAESIDKQAQGAAESVTDTIIGDIQDKLTSILNPKEVDGVTTGFNPTSARAEIAQLMRDLGEPELVKSNRIKFALDVGEDIARGAGRFVAQNAPEIVEEYPALELRRVYSRSIPRGFHLVSGVVIEDPMDSWGERWTAAAAASGDDDARRVYNETERMVALKSSPIWEALGNGAGGYEDTLGNPFPPFAFNSGMDVDEIDREEAIELGLLTKREKPEAADVELDNLFAEIE